MVNDCLIWDQASGAGSPLIGVRLGMIGRNSCYLYWKGWTKNKGDWTQSNLLSFVIHSLTISPRHRCVSLLVSWVFHSITAR